MTSVLVADDQPAVRSGLRILLESEGFDVLGEADDGAAAVELARRLRPDVVLMDIRMPRLDGIEATRALAGPHVADPFAVVVVTTFDLDEYVHGALRAGAKGFVLKDAGPQLLGEAVRAAAIGDALISPRITTRLLRALAPPRAASEPIEPLSPREEDVLRLLARGYTNTEICGELFLSLGTVKTHIGGILTKLGRRNRVEAAMWAYEAGRV